MNLPDILNVALGIVVLYVLLSCIASLLLELLTGAARYREEILYVTVNRLLAGVPDTPWNLSRLVLDGIGRRLPEGHVWFGLAAFLRKHSIREFKVGLPGREVDDAERRDIVQRFWSHPKIRSLAMPGADAPPSIEPSTFAGVLIDVAVPRDAQSTLPDNRLALLRALAAPSDDTPDPLLQTLRTLGLSSEIPVGATGEALWAPFRRNVAAWFNEASSRSTEIYRQTMQRLLLGLGFILALALNADTVRTAHLLSHDRPLRESLAAYSETLVAERNAAVAATPEGDVASTALQTTRTALAQDIERLRDLEQMGFPIGWGGPDRGYYGAENWFELAYASPLWNWLAIPLAFLVVVVLKVVGLGVTAVAVSQGAPFWYEVMNRLLSLRKGSIDSTSKSYDIIPARTLSEASAGSLVVPASALPLEIGHDLSAPATGFNARKGYWLSRASAAAYSPQREIEALVKTTWKFHECHYFDKGGTQGFCASDEQIVVIAFRGTELSDLNDILTDVNANLVAFARAEYQGAPSRAVHKGFHEALDLVWDDLGDRILRWTEPRPGRAARQIFVTGHSLGGALATLVFARLAVDSTRPVPTLYTFGCPKVGDSVFARELDRLYPERLFRFVNDTDIVPQLPPLASFHHAGWEFTFDQDGKLRSEISGLGRLLGYAAGAAKSIKGASRKAGDDRGIAYYVHRCEALAKSS